MNEQEMIATARALTGAQLCGQRVLALQDTSEINFSRHKRSKAAFGRGGNGVDPALRIHPLLVVDGAQGSVLGLWDVQFVERAGEGAECPALAPQSDQTKDKKKRPTDEKQSRRWIAAARAAGELLDAGAASVTVIADREGDLYAGYARRPERVELLVRVQTDRRLALGGRLYAHLDTLAVAETLRVALPAIPGRAARAASLALRFDRVTLCKPVTVDQGLPDTISLWIIDAREIDAPEDAAPVHWRLFSTAPIESCEAARRAIEDYRRRWHIEQLFRSLKSDGLDIENSQIETPGPLRKLAIVALRAAVLAMQLVHARDGADPRPASAAFTADDIEALGVIAPSVDGRTQRLRNPFQPRSLAWAAWIIARLGAWSGAKDDRPPGPITMHRGIARFRDIAHGISITKLVSTQ